jgi:hypothetical protein
MNIEQSLTPKESLDIIARAILRTKENIRDLSFCFLLWGWILTVASLASFGLLAFTGFQYSFLPFPVLALGGVVITVVYLTRRIKRSDTESYVNYFLIRLWVVVGFCFPVSVFVSTAQGLHPATFTLLLAGLGTLVSGLVMSFRPLALGGTVFLLSSIASVYVSRENTLLLIAGAVVVGYLIPGYLLKYSKK